MLLLVTVKIKTLLRKKKLVNVKTVLKFNKCFFPMSQSKTESSYFSFEIKAPENPFQGELSINLTDYIAILFEEKKNSSNEIRKKINQIYQDLCNELSGFDACFFTNEFFIKLFDSLDIVQKQRMMKSPMIYILSNSLFEILKNSINSWIDNYFLHFAKQGFDPTFSHVVRLCVKVSLTTDSIEVSLEDNGGGFSKELLEYFAEKENQILYVRRGYKDLGKKPIKRQRETYLYHYFGGASLGLRILLCGILTNQNNPLCMWFEMDATDFKSYLRDPDYSICFANGESGGALITLTTPIEGPAPLITERHNEWLSSDAEQKNVSLPQLSKNPSGPSITNTSINSKKPLSNGTYIPSLFGKKDKTISMKADENREQSNNKRLKSCP
jgi:hypothetical protein